MKKFTKTLLFINFIFILVITNTAYAQPVKGMTGGLSRTRTGNTVIEVENGFIRSIRGNEVFVWVLGLSAEVKIYPWKVKTNETSPKVLNILMANIYPKRMVLEGAEILKSNDRGIMFQVDLSAEASKTIKLRSRSQDPNFQFVVMGDSRDNPPVFKKILQHANQHKPLFLVNSGDLVKEGGQTEYLKFLKQIQDADYPFFFAMGNHDTRRRGKKYFNELFGPSYYAFTFANNQFIILDNALGRLSDNQYRWLRDILVQNPTMRTFLFLHIPPIEPDTKDKYGMDLPVNTQWLFDLTEEFNIAIIFSSHIHGYWETKQGKTRYISSGGAGAPLDKGGFFHYLLVTVTPNEVKTEIIKIE